MQKQKYSFTLIELLIVLIIIGILVTLAIPQIQGIIISSKMKELYDSIAAIEKAEEMFYYEVGYYAAFQLEPAEYRIGNTWTQAGIDQYKKVLGITLPGINSIFVYGCGSYTSSGGYVADKAVCFNIFVRAYPQYYILAQIEFRRGVNNVKTPTRWIVNSDHPWAKYLKPPTDYDMFPFGHL